MKLWFFEGESRLKIVSLPDPFLGKSVDLALYLIRLEQVVVVPSFPYLISNAFKIRLFECVSLQIELNPLSIGISLQLEEYLLLLQYFLLPIFFLLFFLLM